MLGFNDPIKNENTTTDHSDETRELKQAIEMLNYQISNNFETINELKKDKEYLQQLAKQLSKALEQSQTLNYLDKPKEED